MGYNGDMMTTTDNTRPVVFLDVDGVINDLNWYPKDDDTRTVHNTELGYLVTIARETRELVAALHKVADIYWLTTWREAANRDISPLVGLPSDLPVITDGTTDRWVHWKAEAARPIAEALLAEGRDVYWIEDFYGRLPFIPGVRMVDTGVNKKLVANDIPVELGYLMS